MLYFLYRYFDRGRIFKRYKNILLTRVLVVQGLIVLCKRFSRDINTLTAGTFKHTPKTFGLKFKYFRSLFSKLHTCIMTYLIISPSSLLATFVPLTMYSAYPGHLFFSFPALFRKPWSQCLSPFIWVSWFL
jgi:hypothetical protein